MSGIEVLALMPIIVLAGMAVGLMLVLAFVRSHALSFAMTLAALGMSLAAVAAGGSPRFAAYIIGWPAVTSLVTMDDYSRFFVGLILAQAVVVTLFSYGYLERRGGMKEEFYILLLLATLGAAVLTISTHYASFFLGLEILSVSLYTLIAYHRRIPLSVEAGFKYLILAAVATAFLLLGMALVYAELGTMELAKIAASISPSGHHGQETVILIGFVLIVVGIAFKLALAPFHLWTPDIYQGAPAPVTMFVATVSKGAMFALMLRYFAAMNIAGKGAMLPVTEVFILLAVASMFVGNLLALRQDDLKRMLAYSSIAHLGYLLVAFLAGGPLAAQAVGFYLLAYFITTSGAFGVVTVLSGGDHDAAAIEEYRGLAARRPALAGVLAVMLLSLAGIPLTAGFVGKFYIVAAGVQSDLWGLLVVLAVNSAIGLYYYLRVIAAMYMKPQAPARAGQSVIPRPGTPWPAGLALWGLSGLLVWVGVYPSDFMHLVQSFLGLFWAYGVNAG